MSDPALAADVEAALVGVVGVKADVAGGENVPVEGELAETAGVPLADQIVDAQQRLEAAQTADLRSRRVGDAAAILGPLGLDHRAERVADAVENGASVRGALFIGAGLLPQLLRRPSGLR
jgi:hypothetical protein